MPTELELQSVRIVAPKDDNVAVISVSTSSGEIDLTTRSELGALQPGRFVTVVADGNMWFNLGDAGSGTVDETAVTGDTQAWYLAAGVPFSFIWNGDYKWLRHKASVATKIRIYVSSRAEHEPD